MISFLIVVLFFSSACGSVNKIFFLRPFADVVCPIDASFHQWKKYYGNKMMNLFQEDKKTIRIQLSLDDSPVTYECKATTGFITQSENITVHVIERNSSLAEQICHLSKSSANSANQFIAEHPCFVQPQRQMQYKIEKGSKVSLSCEADGINITYLWYKYKNRVRQFLYKPKTLSTLDIENVDENSVGEYQCVVNVSDNKKIERTFDVQVLDIPPGDGRLINMHGPQVVNITVPLNGELKLECSAEARFKEKIHGLQWGQKVNKYSPVIDAGQTIVWKDGEYRLIADEKIIYVRESDRKILSTLVIRKASIQSGGQYICFAVSSNSNFKHKTFFVNVTDEIGQDNTRSSFFFLYILIPSLVIAMCLFVGIYLTINRRPKRKGATSGVPLHSPNCCKSETDTVRLRSTPDYGNNQYMTNCTNNSLSFTKGSNFPQFYGHSAADKMIV